MASEIPKFEFEEKREDHHGTVVHTHTVMDALRKEHCLCLNCAWAAGSACTTATELHEFCKKHDMAMAITRCPHFVP